MIIKKERSIYIPKFFIKILFFNRVNANVRITENRAKNK